MAGGWTPIAVDSSRMAGAANEFGAKVNEFNGDLQTVNELIATLQRHYTGAGAPQFAQAMNKWEDAFLAIIRSLENIMAAMNVNVDEVVRTTNTAESTAGDFAVAMNALPGV